MIHSPIPIAASVPFAVVRGHRAGSGRCVCVCLCESPYFPPILLLSIAPLGSNDRYSISERYAG